MKDYGGYAFGEVLQQRKNAFDRLLETLTEKSATLIFARDADHERRAFFDAIRVLLYMEQAAADALASSAGDDVFDSKLFPEAIVSREDEIVLFRGREPIARIVKVRERWALDTEFFSDDGSIVGFSDPYTALVAAIEQTRPPKPVQQPAKKKAKRKKAAS